MRKLLSICVSVLCLTAFLGCDKRDCNGDLDGMWQLLEWQDKDQVLRADKDDMIFYSFQLTMASFRKISPEEVYMRSMLKYTPGTICIYNPMEYVGGKHDESRPMSVLAPVGVPEDGIFTIQSMNGDAMVLTTSQGDRLSFRKY